MAQEKSIVKDLTVGPVAPQLIRYALPLIGANFLQALYTLVDLWVVGNYASAAAISAVAISGQIVFLMHAVGMGLGNGGQVLIAQQVGAKDFKNLNRTIGTLITFCMVASIVITLIGALFRSFWFSLLQTPVEAVPDAVVYLLICCIGVPFVYGGGTFCAILRGVGDSKRPMYVLAVSAVINIVLDILFVAFFRWGAAGAAWATSISQIASFLYGLGCMYKYRDQIGFDFRPASFRIDMSALKLLLKLGAPLVFMSASITISMLVVTAFVNSFGVAASAVSGIGTRLNSLVNSVTNGMQTAVASVIAQNFAARKLDRVRKTYMVSNLVCIAFFAIIGAAAFLFPTQIIGLFTQPSETEVLSYAPSYMHIAILLYFAFCTMSTSIGMINAVGYTSLNLIIAILDAVVGRIGLSILFGNVMGMGVHGYWLGNATSAYISVIIGFVYYFSGRWEKRGVLKL